VHVSQDENIESASEGVSRRKLIQRAGVVGAVAWTAPALLSVGGAAFAGSPGPGTCTGCDLSLPCNTRIACGPGGGCNCWVMADRSACFCGPLDSCADHVACDANDQCPSGLTCVENCCGKLCYAPCGEGQGGGAGNGPNGTL
jgi:hypothetical protein